MCKASRRRADCGDGDAASAYSSCVASDASAITRPPALAAGVDLRPATERNASGDVGEPPLPMSDEPESAGEACERDVVGESAMLA